MLNEAVGQSEAPERHGDIAVGEQFEHGRTDAAFAGAVFDYDEVAVAARYIYNECLVERFGKAQIDVRDAPVGRCAALEVECTRRGGMFGGQPLEERGHFCTQGAEGEHGQRAVAAPQEAAATDFDGFERTPPVGARTGTAGIANHEGAAFGQLSRVHEAPQLAFVHW